MQSVWFFLLVGAGEDLGISNVGYVMDLRYKHRAKLTMDTILEKFVLAFIHVFIWIYIWIVSTQDS